ncbi:methyltransferase domain-containing protein [Tabrizicola sp.]|uniref:methyltransferase domain-containing protein n=1 Tax=Tabrizicola sp. TaxID=2005166 RepID=UPI003F2AB65F
MSQAPILVDAATLARHRARARRLPGHAEAMFLHRVALSDLQERLVEVNRSFTRPAIVTAFPEIWREVVADARLVPDGETLDLEPGGHDLVIHAMGLHWANDPLGQLIQCRRALAPDGLFLGVLPGGRSLQELRSSLAEAEVGLTGGLSPRVLPMAEIRDLGGLLQRAGFALPVADGFLQTVSYPSMPALMADLRAMGETNALAARMKRFTARRLLQAAADVYAAGFGGRDGRIPVTFELIFLTGWAPHESQQVPLRPGSAKARLADALRVPERPLPEGG